MKIAITLWTLRDNGGILYTSAFFIEVIANLAAIKHYKHFPFGNGCLLDGKNLT